MRALFTLVTQDVRLQHVFMTMGAYPYLECIQHVLVRQRATRNNQSMLVIACRQILACVEESRINAIAKDLSYMLIASPGSITSDMHVIEASVLLERLLNLRRPSVYNCTDQECVLINNAGRHTYQRSFDHAAGILGL